MVYVFINLCLFTFEFINFRTDFRIGIVIQVVDTRECLIVEFVNFGFVLMIRFFVTFLHVFVESAVGFFFFLCPQFASLGFFRHEVVLFSNEFLFEASLGF